MASKNRGHTERLLQTAALHYYLYRGHKPHALPMCCMMHVISDRRAAACAQQDDSVCSSVVA